MRATSRKAAECHSYRFSSPEDLVLTLVQEACAGVRQRSPRVESISDFDGSHSSKSNDEVKFYAFGILAMRGDDPRKLPLSLRMECEPSKSEMLSTLGER